MITKMGVPFNGLAGAGFSGSYKGMRFFMTKKILAYSFILSHIILKILRMKIRRKWSFLILTKAWTSALTGLIRNTLTIKINGMRHLIQE